ncbi:MAG TPA: PAS domain S-box protein [Sideroxyarcus sp.]|nr:PAS domain S-box protein [Sideroxyarcus sp.]
MAAPVIAGAPAHWRLGKPLLLALVYFATGKLGLYFPTQDNHITLFWLPTGIAVAALLRWGTPHTLAGIFLGALLIDLDLGTTFPLALVGAAGNTLAPLIAVWLLRRLKFDPFFTRQFDLFALLVAATLSTLLPAAIGVGTLWLGSLIQPDHMPLAWLNWWLGDAVSIILAGPLLLSFNKMSRNELLKRPTESLLCTLLLFVSGWLVFLSDVHEPVIPIAFLPLPVVLWAALRLGVTGSSLVVLLLSCITAVGTALGKGVFGSFPAEVGMYLAWLYMFIVALVGLMATTMLGERKKIESSLLNVNELLRETQSVAKIGSWRINTQTQELLWSDETYRIFGIPVGTPMTYQDFLGRVHPDDRAQVDIEWHTALNGTPYQIQHRIVVDGETRWVEERARLDIDTDSQVHSVTGSVQDITDNKIAQRRIEHSESRYKALLQQAADAMFIHDFNGRILEVNQQACDTLGYSSEELCQMRLEEIAPNFQLNASQPKWEQLDPGKPVCFNSFHRRKDGSIFPVEVRLVVLELDHEKVVMALASDISERQHAEAALQESEARYRSFAERLPLGIAVLQDGLIKYVNHATTELIGYSTDELMGKPFPHLIHEDDRAGMLDLHRRRMQGEDVEGRFPVRIIRKDGAVRQWELHTSTTDWAGKRSSLAILVDITERNAMEEALRNSLRQLEEKGLAKTRFLAAAGHDLRQPVAAANLFVDALRLAATDTRQKELIERLAQSMGIFSNLLERLLDISKFDAGLIKPQFVTFNLAELFNWLEQSFANLAQEKGLSFRLHFPMNKLVIVRTDVGLLQSVVMNLVSNALKFTTSGGILVSARLRNDKVILQVWDTGSGINDADLPYIFDEFYQANNPQRSREGGLGLGLSICRRAISLLGATVTCRSRSGHGSVFEFCLPLHGKPHEQGHLTPINAPDEVANEQLVKGKRVVVVEDDALVAHGMLDLMQGMGATVLRFRNAEEALHHSEIAAADFFIVDYALGGKLSGIQFLETLQQRQPAPIRAVVVTGETSSQFIHNTADCPWPVLHKPVNYAKLTAGLCASRK